MFDKMKVMKVCLSVIVVSFLLLFSACAEKDIETFSGKRQIYFDKFYMNALPPGMEEGDTTRTSFFFYPEGTPSIKVKLAVNLSGPMLTSDVQFSLNVIESEGTAQAGEYKLEDVYTFRARPVGSEAIDVQDTIEMTLIYSDRLEGLGEKGILLVLELVPNENLDLGQFERRRAVIVWSEVEAKPDWWDYEVTWALLGEYSYEKYKLFLETVDTDSEFNGDLVKNDPSRAIEMVRMFKKWLTDHLGDPDKGEMYKRILDSLKV